MDLIGTAPGTALASEAARWKVTNAGWRIWFLLISMVVVTIFFGSINGYYLTVSHFLDMGRQASTLIVTAIGMNMVIMSGEIDLSVGAIVGLVCVSLPQMIDYGVPMPIAVIFSVAIGAAVGALNGVITLRLLVPSFLATLGTMAIARGVAIFISDQPRQVNSDAYATIFNGTVFGIPQTFLYAVVVAIFVAALWNRSKFGIYVRAVGSSEQGARFAGLQTLRLKMIVLVLSGAFAAGGALLLLGRTLTGLAVAADGLELNAIAAVILGGGRLGGGSGNVVGACLGAFLLTMIFSGIAGMGLTAAWQLLIKGAILVVVILFMQK